MARDQETRSVRRDPSLTEGRRDVVLSESRRFFTSQGSDKATRQARALQGALGLGVDAYTSVLERRNVRGANQATQEAATGGERDVDNVNKGYNETFDQVEASNDLAIFASELPQLLTQEGWSDLPEDQAQARIDQYYSEQLEGINPDSVYGQLVAQGILKQNAQLLDVHRTVQAEKAQQERRIMVDNELRSDYELDGTIDHTKLMDRLHTLVPGPGGRMTYLESVFDLAEDMGDVSLIDSIPETFPSGDPTGINDPNMEDVFDKARGNAVAVKAASDKAEQDAFTSANQTALAQLHSRDKQMADAGDQRVLANIAEGGTESGPNQPRRYSEAQQTALYDRYLNSVEKAGIDAALVNEFATGNAIGLTQAEYDTAFNGFVDQAMKNMPDDLSEEDQQSAVRLLSIERSVVNGKLPSVFKDQLSVNTSNPEKFKEAVELYNQFEGQHPGFVESQISNTQSRMLDTFDRMLAETGGDEERALELIRGFQPGRSAGFNKEINTAVDLAVAEVSDSKPGWGDYAINARLRQTVAENVRHYVDMGFDPEVAGQYAFEHVTRRTIRVGDHVYEKNAGWGNAPQMVYDWALQNEAQHRGVDADTLTIVPTNDPKLVRFQSTDDILPSTKYYRIDTLAGDHQRYALQSQDQQLESFTTGTPERLKEAETRAFAEMYPANPWLESGARASVERMQRERWANMPQSQKDRLIQAQMR